jgi:hypothetical protein
MEQAILTIEFNKAGLEALLDAVNHRLETWPGGHPTEQTNLYGLQNTLRAALLEYTFYE